MAADTLLATLRHATAAHHARAEARVPVLDPALTLEGYAAVLARFHAAYRELEPALAGVHGWPAGFDVPRRRKLPLLERDLAWLGARGIALDTPPVRARGHVAPPALPAAIGMLYVMEGATLGGQVILRRITPRLGVTAEAGASFYASYGAETGAMWRGFTATADAWGAAHRERWSEVVDSARRTFDAIVDVFER